MAIAPAHAPPTLFTLGRQHPADPAKTIPAASAAAGTRLGSGRRGRPARRV